MFKNEEIELTECLDHVQKGLIQLPDFQRSWRWDDDHVQRLLRSLIRGFPIGSLTRIETGGELELLHREVEGTTPTENPISLLLDGQQRVTALYCSLSTKAPVPVKSTRSSKRQERFYYIDMAQIVNNWLDGNSYVRVASEKKILTRIDESSELLDLSDSRSEYMHHMFPVNSLLEPDDWLQYYQEYWAERGSFPYGEHWRFVNRFKDIVSRHVKFRRIPVTNLTNVADTETVCSIFENVNMGAEPLTVFELLTAKLAARGLKLRDDWDERKERLHRHGTPREDGVLCAIDGYQFLQVIALLATNNRRQTHSGGRRVGCDGRDVLTITADEYRACSQAAEEGLVAAARFLQHLCVVKRSDLAYVGQLVSLGAIYGLLGKVRLGRDAEERLERWYWSRLFSEAYSGAVNTQIARDIEEVPAFVTDPQRTSLIGEVNFDPERLLHVKTRGSAVFKGLIALQIRNGCTDWSSGEKIDIDRYLDGPVDVHHIFPKKWCDTNLSTHRGGTVRTDIRDCAINKTPLTRDTNQSISSLAPSEYVTRLRNKNSKVDDAITSSLVDVKHLETDAFNEFFIERGVALMQMLSDAMEQDLDTTGNAFRDALVQAGLMSSDT